MTRRPPGWLLVSGLVVAALAVLPAVYLGVRAAEADADTWALLWRDKTWGLLWRTLGLAVAVTACAALVALPLAWLTTQTDLPGRRGWTVLLCVPLAVPTFVSGYVLLATFGNGGVLEEPLSRWGLPVPSVYGFPGALLALTVSTYPYLFLALRAGLLSQDPAWLEGARSLGMSPARAFWKVTAPLLRPAFVSGALLVGLYVLSDFGAVALLQYDAFSRAIYVQYEGAYDRTYAALLGLALVVVTAAVLVLEVRLRGRAGYHRSAKGAARVSAPVSLGRWRLPALLLCGAVVAVGVVLPVGVLVYWGVRGLVGESASMMAPALGSVLASVLGAVASVLGALPLAFLAVRYPGRLTLAMERVSYVGYALPPIVLALSLVFLGVRALPFLYGTLAMLVLAYVVRFLPQAVGMVRSALLQLNPHLAEAAASLGQSPPAVFRRVTAPLLRPGLLAGAALVFLTAMKELPATLLLAPIGFETLATRVWGATAEGRFAEAALPALVLMAISALGVGLLVSQEGDAPRG
ncbi:iron ABC transporter permease [Myxococcus llanfairpwllgwyngyllgogerychwyrndrobwllllantysiliogogogochensis]|uniref:Iron ABC transporter permease n=1 Tax=Myxococcus llanfairpwllgwyngyllgogerychwyrndrobwllllantysiliogogogochensis TaxID=2590453 RepID=A0A540WNQ7_9BACT|nr:iron ABC transporter permease [Myxococcus llanfairpwllgwyngyllgogerychwyrndrobwllllantysiliogogogochensis]TQF10653.1 iron ABC transporter permease [Myxococcus llanfairpwllgwyngyllgogerychwyrndrobwllllantysiliogogogochensis]